MIRELEFQADFNEERIDAETVAAFPVVFEFHALMLPAEAEVQPFVVQSDAIRSIESAFQIQSLFIPEIFGPDHSAAESEVDRCIGREMVVYRIITFQIEEYGHHADFPVLVAGVLESDTHTGKRIFGNAHTVDGFDERTSVFGIFRIAVLTDRSAHAVADVQFAFVPDVHIVRTGLIDFFSVHARNRRLLRLRDCRPANNATTVMISNFFIVLNFKFEFKFKLKIKVIESDEFYSVLVTVSSTWI